MRQRLFPVELKIDIDCYYYKPNHFVNTPKTTQTRNLHFKGIYLQKKTPAVRQP